MTTPPTGFPGPAPAAGNDREAIRRAAAGLEEALIRQMLSAMAKAQLEGGSFFGSGAAEGTQQTTFEMLLSQQLSNGSPLGLADALADQMTGGHEGRPYGTIDRIALDFLDGAVPIGNSAPVFRNFTPGPQAPADRSDEKDGTPRTGRSCVATEEGEGLVSPPGTHIRTQVPEDGR